MAAQNKLYIKTYGCQMNVYDSMRMKDLLEPHGYSTTETIEDANLAIINTCHIREKASEKLYSELGRIKILKDSKKRQGTDLKVVVAGCVAQAEGEEIFSRAPYVDIVVGPQSYHNIPELIRKSGASRNLIELDFIDEEKFDKLPLEYHTNKSSALVSVQEGCDKFCSFCVVPYTRGAEFSRAPEDVYRETLAFVSQGAKEVTLLGQNVNAYHGKTSDGEIYSLAKLIELLSKIESLKRIRYITSHPIDMSDDLIMLHGTSEKLMPFLHLPIQSGSDKILKEMNRKHDRNFYLEIIERLRDVRKDIALSSDFIVGFPGETDKDFEATLEIVKQVKYSQCFSFKYSPRPGTPASIKKQVEESVKAERLQILQDEIRAQQLNFNQSCVGMTLPVLFEKPGKFDGQLSGKSPYLQSVNVTSATTNYMDKIVDVKIISAHQSSLSGEIIPNPRIQ
ncbi:MAG: tRNA (N6-isopentenyl adenosine(37)-C2)-methylthiotransferase MiaB [Rickettsiaceae bacterium]|nr:tRNA (N6-isopentenyl adenosine(37)-C2)-methylthiotransferase MiaB [Rickettsiaceae bacterium]